MPTASTRNGHRVNLPNCRILSRRVDGRGACPCAGTTLHISGALETLPAPNEKLTKSGRRQPQV